MESAGKFVLTLGIIGCVWAALIGTATVGAENAGFGAIAVAIAAAGGVYAGIKLIEIGRRSN